MSKRALGTLRIIGGTHRSRIVLFDPKTGVRPTPDRVRQTLFDWLMPLIAGARCLDLFAGSGALGFEAISRGAAHVTFVETGKTQAAAISAALRVLREEPRAQVVETDALRFIASRLPSFDKLRTGSLASRFDVVFLDPPYDTDLLMRVLQSLSPHLAPVNRVYLEWRERAKPSLPAGFVWLREKQAGQVCFGLAAYEKH